MKRVILSLAIGALLTWAAGAANAQCTHCGGTGCCYQEVVVYRCVQVPDVKKVKKVFYECRCEPFCVPALPKFLHCDCCPGCECPRFKKVLVKREVEVGEICGTKCEVQECIERVQVPCCHCCPQAAPAGAPASELPPIPAASPDAAPVPPPVDSPDGQAPAPVAVEPVR